MLSEISWPAFIQYTSLVVVIYYCSVGLLFYRRELMAFQEAVIKGRKPKPRTEKGAGNKKARTPFEILREELESYFEGCAKLRPVKEEYLMGLQSLMRESPYTPDATERIQLHAYIRDRSQTICSIALSNHEVDGLWKR
jgi:hypothetical protein